MSRCTYTDCSYKEIECCYDCDRLEGCTGVCHFIKDKEIENGEQSNCEYYEEDEDE